MIKFLLALSIFARACLAIVVTTVPGVEQRFYSPPSSEVSPEQQISVRIRSTRECDLNSIARILAIASVRPYRRDESKLVNFRHKMDMLRAQAGYGVMLQARYQAVQAGIEMTDDFDVAFDDPKRLRMLWMHDAYRGKVERAAKLSSEPTHVWRRHNFDCAPPSSRWLQHKMLTAEDSKNGKVVGFMEVAMMTDPTSIGDDGSTVAQPTVANLAVSPEYRRRGIASRLLGSASRYVRQEWTCPNLRLYVEKENEPAFSMYNNLGFRVESEANSRGKPHWYMARGIA